eukprot:360988-Chlamydomonas_euryale.AAC.11
MSHLTPCKNVRGAAPQERPRCGPARTPELRPRKDTRCAALQGHRGCGPARTPEDWHRPMMRLHY